MVQYSRMLLGSSIGHNTDSLVSLTFRSVLLLVSFCCTIPGLSSVHVLTPTCNQWVIEILEWLHEILLPPGHNVPCPLTSVYMNNMYNYIIFFISSLYHSLWTWQILFLLWLKHTPSLYRLFDLLYMYCHSSSSCNVWYSLMSMTAACVCVCYLIIDYVTSCSKYFISSYAHGPCCILLLIEITHRHACKGQNGANRAMCHAVTGTY